MTDAISRSAVLENIYEMDISDCTDVEDIIDKAYATIADAPALDVAPVVHARWLWVKDHWECSACRGSRFHDIALGCDASYCGRCGARMDGEP